MKNSEVEYSENNLSISSNFKYHVYLICQTFNKKKRNLIKIFSLSDAELTIEQLTKKKVRNEGESTLKNIILLYGKMIKTMDMSMKKRLKMKNFTVLEVS